MLSCSNMGAIIRHGPHQSALKSITSCGQHKHTSRLHSTLDLGKRTPPQLVREYVPVCPCHEPSYAVLPTVGWWRYLRLASGTSFGHLKYNLKWSRARRCLTSTTEGWPLRQSQSVDFQPALSCVTKQKFSYNYSSEFLTAPPQLLAVIARETVPGLVTAKGRLDGHQNLGGIFAPVYSPEVQTWPHSRSRASAEVKLSFCRTLSGHTSQLAALIHGISRQTDSRPCFKSLFGRSRVPGVLLRQETFLTHRVQTAPRLARSCSLASITGNCGDAYDRCSVGDRVHARHSTDSGLGMKDDSLDRNSIKSCLAVLERLQVCMRTRNVFDYRTVTRRRDRIIASTALLGQHWCSTQLGLICVPDRPGLS